MEEKDLYLPVKELFVSLDFQVYGEVKTVDVVAQREDLLIAIELKKELNLHLIAQGAYRQRLTDYVYIAVPTPTSRVQRGNPYKDKVFLLRRLGLGLIYVSLSRKTHTAKIILEPNLLDLKASQSRHKRRRVALQKEIAERHSDYNIGGTRGAIMTAYKEAAIRLLVACKDGNVHTTKELRASTGIQKSAAILNKNYYGWFQNITRGTYAITPVGQLALKEYDAFIQLISETLLENKKEDVNLQ